MNNVEFIDALKQMNFKELVNAYLEAHVGKEVDFEAEFYSGDRQLLEDLDSAIFFYISQNK